MSAAVLTGLILAAGVIVSGIYAAIRGAIRFAQYLVRSEEAQLKTAVSNREIADDLARYMRSADEHFLRVEAVVAEHGQEIAVLRDRTRIRRQVNGAARA